MRMEISDKCNALYRMNLEPDDINDCDGCKAETGILFSGCHNCEIRKCASRKNLLSCAYCSNYACEKLIKHFLMNPGTEKRLGDNNRT